jgi:hypothetical protein
MNALAMEPLSLERVVEAFRCRRLPWWREQGLAAEPAVEELPLPWPSLPPGWRLGGRGQARVVVEDAEGLWGRCDWLVQGHRGCHLVVLGHPTPTLRLRARLLGALWERARGAAPGLWFQAPGGRGGSWDGVWPAVQRVGAASLSPEALVAAAEQVRETLESPWPPEGTAPAARCWDCPGFCFCGDRG